MPSKLLFTAAAFALSLSAQAASANDYTSLMKAKKFPEVERAASAKLAQEPNNIDAMVARTEAILATGDESRIAQAVKQAEQCVSIHPDSALCHLTLGRALGTKATAGGIMAAMSYAGDIRNAFKKAVELDPRNMDARFGLLQYYTMAPAIAGGGTGKARDLATQTAAINAEAAKLMLASIEMKDGDLAKAEAAALAAHPGTDADLLERQEDALLSIGTRYVADKKPAEGERVLRDTFKRFPASEAAPYWIARAQQEQGKHREALAGFEQILVKAPAPNVDYRIGKSYMALGEKAKAIAAFEKALSAKTGLAKKNRSDAEDQLKALRA